MIVRPQTTSPKNQTKSKKDNEDATITKKYLHVGFIKGQVRGHEAVLRPTIIAHIVPQQEDTKLAF